MEGEGQKTDVVMAANTADAVALLLFVYDCED